MNCEDKISVIVPVYNVEKYLKKCVESIRSQTYTNLEIILVDDGSPDNCPAICDEFANKDSRIRVIHQTNGGLSAARNAGLEVATGEYIAFVDSDDYIHPEMYHRLYSTLRENNAQLAIGAITCIDDCDNILEMFVPADEVIRGVDTLERLQLDNCLLYVVAWNKLYHRKLFRNICYPVGKINEDNAIAHVILAEADRVVTVSDGLYYYVQRPNSIMRNISVKSLNDVEMFYYRLQYFEKQGYDVYVPGVCKKLLDQYCRYRYSVHSKSLEEFLYLKEVDRLARTVYQHPGVKKSRKDSLRYNIPELFVLVRRIKEFLRWGRFMMNALWRYLGPTENSSLLVDTPTHGNLGDHAIVLAEQQYLKEVTGNGSAFEITAQEFSRYGKWLARIMPPKRTILIPGGGFLGRLWPDEERRFRQILQTFTKQRIVVFPQTVTFDLETENGCLFFEESKAIYEAHPDLTVFVREKKSLSFMQEHMPKVRCILTPDIVTVLHMDVPKQERNGVLLCLRSDREKVLSHPEVAFITDCVGAKLPQQSIQFTDTVVDYSIDPAVRAREVGDKLAQFAGAKLIVTDRLHGMIFAALVGTPCVVLSNTNGKVKRVYEWIKDLPYVRFVDQVEALPVVLAELELDQEYSYDDRLVREHFRPLENILKEIE